MREQKKEPYWDFEAFIISGYRYYSSSLGRWINRDPKEEDDGKNLYGFVENNPIGYFDLLGLKSLSFEQIERLVSDNNLSKKTNELITCLIWNESNFDPVIPHAGGMARGLMGIIKTGGFAQANKIRETQKESKFQWDDMNDAAKNIKVGSLYLQWVSERPGDYETNLKYKYGTGETYPTGKILQCEKCLIDNRLLSIPSKECCLKIIHN